MTSLSNPLVTFIIPTIGRDTLTRTIESLEKQTNKNWKAIIIFDGCSPTIELNSEKIQIIQIEKKGEGSNSAGNVRNEGIKHATTEWIAFVDDDDTIASNYVETLYNEIQEFNNVDVVIFRMSYDFNKELIYPPLNESYNFYSGNVGISFAMKKTLFDLGYIFTPSSGEDYYLLCKIRENNYKMMISPYIRYFVRCNEYIEQTNNTVIGNRGFIN
jgi:glycosyltransferase involved in cell wall biosynthesis